MDAQPSSSLRTDLAELRVWIDDVMTSGAEVHVHRRVVDSLLNALPREQRPDHLGAVPESASTPVPAARLERLIRAVEMRYARRPTDDPEYRRAFGTIAEAISSAEYNGSKARGAQKRYWTGVANRWRLQGRQLARDWYERKGLPVPAELRDVPRRRS